MSAGESGPTPTTATGATNASGGQHSRLWGPPTLKRWNRRTMALSAAVVFLVWFVNELYAQIYLQIALAHAADGDYTAALESVESVRRNVFRRGTAAELKRDARFHTLLERSREAVKVQNWFLAKSLLQEAADRALPAQYAQLVKAFGEWRVQLDALLERGEPTSCRPALDALESLELGEGAAADQRRSLVVDAALRLVDTFRERGSWTAASEEIQRARDLQLDPARIDSLRGSLREGLATEVEEAVAAQDYDRAQSLTLLLDSLFPSDHREGERTLESLQILAALDRGETLEGKGDFDGALREYDRALLLDRGRGGAAFQHVAALRERLRDFEKDGGQWVPRQRASSDLLEVSRQFRRWSSHRVPSSENGISFVTGSLNHYPLAGDWTCSAVQGREPAWILRGTVHVEPRSGQPAPADARIGFALLDARRDLLAASTGEVPFLLSGQSHEFELRIPHRDGEAYVSVGILVPR